MATAGLNFHTHVLMYTKHVTILWFCGYSCGCACWKCQCQDCKFFICLSRKREKFKVVHCES